LQSDPGANQVRAGLKAERGTGGLPRWPRLPGGTDQIATLRIIAGQNIEWQSSLYISFIDFEKTFDSISREVLLRLLRYYGMPAKVVNIIRVLYVGFSAQVVHNGQRTQPLHIKARVTQGCLLSPLLFLVTLDWVKRTVFDRKRGIQWTFTASIKRS